MMAERKNCDEGKDVELWKQSIGKWNEYKSKEIGNLLGKQPGLAKIFTIKKEEWKVKNKK